MSDERDSAGSAGDGTGSDDTDGGNGQGDSQGAVVTQPTRPTGKRSRRGAVETAESEDSDAALDTDAAVTKNGKGKAKATKKDGGGSRNPFTFVTTFLRQVVAELRKVIWPNRKQMVSYTTVVLTFLVFMVALIYGTDMGVHRLISLVFG